MTGNELLGVPIRGEISHYSNKPYAEPKDPQGFIDAIMAALDVDQVDSIRWSQYTPYFNDGDPCYFSVGEPLISFVGNNEDSENYIEGDYGDFLADYELGNEEQNQLGVSSDDMKVIKAAFDAINDVGYERLLQDTFGDPAEVTIGSDDRQFHVEYYEHD